jgi:hypothetical protein
MKSAGVGLGLLVLSALAQSETDARTYLTLGGQTQPVWFICDGLETPTVAVVGKPTAANQVRITRFSKANPAQYSSQVYTLGRPDPGAGQVYYRLSLGGKEVGFVHATNPGMLEHPDLVYTQPITSLKVLSGETGCRWSPGTRFFGFSPRRSVLVSQDSSGVLTYQSFDFPRSKAGQSELPSLEIKGGKSLAGGFSFANKGYIYTVRKAGNQARVTVRRGGKLLLSEPFIAFTVAGPR